MKNTGAHEPNANDVLAKMLREEARKRDYGDGAPRWSVYYHGSGEAAAPGHKTGPPAIGAAAAASARRPSDHRAMQNNIYRINHSNFVSESVKGFARGDEAPPRINAAEAAAQSLSDACDVDGDGMLDLFEIVKTLMLRPHLLKPIGLKTTANEATILEMFKKADADNSGYLTKDELMHFLTEERVGKTGLEHMNTRLQAQVEQHRGMDRDFGAPLVSRPGTRELGVPSKRFPTNRVCQNEFFTKGEKPGENANVMAARYYKEVGRPFEGQLMINTCQKLKSMGKGKCWESEVQPTNAPYRRGNSFVAGLRQEHN